MNVLGGRVLISIDLQSPHEVIYECKCGEPVNTGCISYVWNCRKWQFEDMLTGEILLR